MRKLLIVLSCLFLIQTNVPLLAEEKTITYIIEVEGNPLTHAQYIKKHYNSLEVVETFTILLQAVAVKGQPRAMKKLLEEAFVQDVYDVQTYTTSHENTSIKDMPKDAVFPEALHETGFTGKGVKVAVIDTGIDLHHPDLQANIKGGYDVVDFKAAPQETEGVGATNHGSHVAGIIGAKGAMKGVAIDSDLYAYRALGPGGMGSSVHVIAAMEKALEDEVDIMNLSLGNVINGPDYPTSKAVNEAVKQGVMVVVANGNDGPADWTVGAPATASKALSVGAYQGESYSSYFYHALQRKKIPIQVFTDPAFWLEENTYTISTRLARKKVYIMKEEDKLQEQPWQEIANKAEALLIPRPYLDEKLLEKISNLEVPIALVEEKDANWLSKQETFYALKADKQAATTAPFSSRGPVTVNWQMKPDLLAPGVNIVSTVPGGYAMLNGTSMAAPHVAGALAVLKEAHPEWTNDQVIAALKTSALRMENIKPTTQGAGVMQLESAIHTSTILHDNVLAFGKMTKKNKEKTLSFKIENVTDKPITYHIEEPKKIVGMTWQLPAAVTVGPHEVKEIACRLKISPILLNEGMHEGYIEMKESEKRFSLPYIFMHETADFPKVMGTNLQLHSLQNNELSYEMYLTEKAEEVKINFLDAENLTIEETIILEEDFKIGMNKGSFRKEHSDNEIALLTIRFTNGEITQTYVSF